MAEKRSGAASVAAETTPMIENQSTKGSDQIENLPHEVENVKSDRSRAAQLQWLLYHIGGSTEMVEEVRKIYPKFDKTGLSKAKNADSYGVEICSDALNALWLKYAPEEYAKRKRHSDGHKLNKRLQCRVDDKTYELFQQRSREHGYKDTNECLAMLVRLYIKRDY